MIYKEINDKWKVFLAENAFKEDKIIPKRKKKNKKRKLLQGEEKDCSVNEWEEFDEEKDQQLDEFSGAGAVAGAPGNIEDKPLNEWTPPVIFPTCPKCHKKHYGAAECQEDDYEEYECHCGASKWEDCTCPQGKYPKKKKKHKKKKS